MLKIYILQVETMRNYARKNDQDSSVGGAVINIYSTMAK